MIQERSNSQLFKLQITKNSPFAINLLDEVLGPLDQKNAF